MRVWVFVEGPSDKLGLEALWRPWQAVLGARRIGLTIGHLDNEGNFLKVFGQRAARALAARSDDLVVGLPDLYPNSTFAGTPFAHPDVAQLRTVLVNAVRRALAETQQLPTGAMESSLDRLHCSAMKHDFEMLLLAAADQLRSFLRTSDSLGRWRHPVEDQDQGNPPKRVVDGLVRRYRGRRYQDTVDAPAVLREVRDLSALLTNRHGQSECPVFRAALDWLGRKTGVPLY